MLAGLNMQGDRARSYFGWEPKHRSFVSQIDVYLGAMMENERKKIVSPRY